jgi:hypothetical protein
MNSAASAAQCPEQIDRYCSAVLDNADTRRKRATDHKQVRSLSVDACRLKQAESWCVCVRVDTRAVDLPAGELSRTSYADRYVVRRRVLFACLHATRPMA